MHEVIIVGGGIGGLTAAAAMRRQGIDAQVFEAAPELGEVGAGIWVPTNAMQVLDRLDLAAGVRQAGHRIEGAELLDYRGGLLRAIDFRDSAERYGHSTVAIHRADLQRVLVEALPAGTLHTGTRLEGFAVDGAGRVHARFAGGDESEAAVLAGADGIHSAVRGQLFPSAALRYSGQSSYRAVVPFELPGALDRTSREIWGPGRRFGFSSIGAGRVYWYATWDAEVGGRDGPGEARVRIEALSADFPAPVPELVAATAEDRLVRTDLFDLRPIPSWHRGPVVLIGDAAHAATPNLGQGGAQAIEDAYVLARVLADALARNRRPANRDLEHAFRRFEALRMRKARTIVDRSWRLGKLAHWKNPLARAARNALLRRMPASVGRRQVEALHALG